eukprot:818609-Prymnesium_polylepis.1
MRRATARTLLRTNSKRCSTRSASHGSSSSSKYPPRVSAWSTASGCCTSRNAWRTAPHGSGRHSRWPNGHPAPHYRARDQLLGALSTCLDCRERALGRWFYPTHAVGRRAAADLALGSTQYSAGTTRARRNGHLRHRHRPSRPSSRHLQRLTTALSAGIRTRNRCNVGARVSGEVASVPRSRYPRHRTARAVTPDAQTATPRPRPAIVLEINYSALSALVSIVVCARVNSRDDSFTPLRGRTARCCRSGALGPPSTVPGRHVRARTATSGTVTARQRRKTYKNLLP